ncbi:hypothetical protein K440DRAFT_664172 [Wilcoxina mikolae CBS 423.85]|nr:hypothetical protein K440DRAFT_664172 [Wilcoxina mikolae CBS 423.85]
MLSSIMFRSKSAPPNKSPTPVSDATTLEAKVAFLNQSLQTLHEVFPGGDIEEIRRLLTTTSEESRLYVVTEMLLKSGSRIPTGTRAQQLEPWEKFRSNEYQRAVKNALYKEFRGLSKSTVQAVMAEHNFMYTRSRATLAEIAAKSWRFSLSNLFRRSPRFTSFLDPSTRPSTGCKELDDELFDLGRELREAQIAADREIAAQLNEAEHADANELLECQCCFGDYAWEETVVCTEGHFFCHGCLIRSVQESIYGQGKSLLTTHCSVRCLSSSASPPCTSSVPADILRAVLPDEIYHSLEDRTASESLEKSGLKLIRCPFCGYAEADELQPYRIKCSALAIGIMTPFVAISSLSALLPGFALLWRTCLALLLIAFSPLLSTSTSRLSAVIRQVHLRRRGTLFRCYNPRCSRESCILCSKEWAPFHKCYEREEDAVRIFVEKAMADAVKRTCPLCHVSFIKSDGCNKLTCPYIREVGYKHFCQHFRQVPGTPCSECDACGLYVNEDEAMAIRHAALAAEEEYWKRHGKPEGWTWRGVGGPVVKEVGERWGVRERMEAMLDGALGWAVEKIVEFG